VTGVSYFCLTVLPVMRSICCAINDRPQSAMNILHVISSVNPETGGPIEVILTSASVLKEQGFTHEVMSLDSPLDPWTKSIPMPLHVMGIRSPLYLKLRRKIPWLRYGYTPHFVPWLKANAKRYDAIVVHGLWDYVALGSRRALAKSKIPYFVYAHGMLDPYFNKAHPVKAAAKQIVWWFSGSPLLAKARNVFFATEEERRLARHSFWPFRCRDRVIAFGTQDVPENADAQIAAFRAALPQLAGRKFLLFLSRIHPKKGCDLLIQAFAKTAAAARDLELDLIIAGPDQAGLVNKLKAMAADLGVADRIHWPGMLKGDQKWGAFRSAEAFVLPSHQENFGMVIAEAMACGKPVLTTDKVNTWREVQDSGAGLIAHDDLEGITRLLEQFLDLSSQEKQAMGQRARQGFLEKFDIGTMAPQLIEAFRSTRD
jgi:glycosyltransferase involved in cell wall biosynthesis